MRESEETGRSAGIMQERQPWRTTFLKPPSPAKVRRLRRFDRFPGSELDCSTQLRGSAGLTPASPIESAATLRRERRLSISRVGGHCLMIQEGFSQRGITRARVEPDAEKRRAKGRVIEFAAFAPVVKKECLVVRRAKDDYLIARLH